MALQNPAHSCFNCIQLSCEHRCYSQKATPSLLSWNTAVSPMCGSLFDPSVYTCLERCFSRWAKNFSNLNFGLARFLCFYKRAYFHRGLHLQWFLRDIIHPDFWCWNSVLCQQCLSILHFRLHVFMSISQDWLMSYWLRVGLCFEKVLQWYYITGVLQWQDSFYAQACCRRLPKCTSACTHTDFVSGSGAVALWFWLCHRCVLHSLVLTEPELCKGAWEFFCLLPMTGERCLMKFTGGIYFNLRCSTLLEQWFLSCFHLFKFYYHSLCLGESRTFLLCPVHEFNWSLDQSPGMC